MRISCPFCGDRDASEFVFRGDATPHRPPLDNEDDLVEYLYVRDNIAGPVLEYAYHAQGCRTWLIIERDTRDHTIAKVTEAAGAVR